MKKRPAHIQKFKMDFKQDSKREFIIEGQYDHLKASFEIEAYDKGKKGQGLDLESQEFYQLGLIFQMLSDGMKEAAEAPEDSTVEPRIDAENYKDRKKGGLL